MTGPRGASVGVSWKRLLSLTLMRSSDNWRVVDCLVSALYLDIQIDAESANDLPLLERTCMAEPGFVLLNKMLSPRTRDQKAQSSNDLPQSEKMNQTA